MKLSRLLATLTAVTVLLVLSVPPSSTGPQTAQAAASSAVLPDWAKSATIYEVNIRQYTPEGTFKAFEKQLPRLHSLGVKILWFMPIHPISKTNRKGTLGSPYSVDNYKEVNPEYGTKQDFKELVTAAHAAGFKVIMDWVANHSGFDNPWTKNAGWYTTKNGVIQSPNDDWTDVADLNYESKDMRNAMLDAMKYWVTEFDIDGYRCDVSFEVPVDFWNSATTELQKIKPLFMLSEAQGAADQLQQAFVADYGWNLLQTFNNNAREGVVETDFTDALTRLTSDYPTGTFSMNFITNHDENTWNGTEYERLGAYVKRFSALYFTVPGIPLIYSGQEVGLNRRLAFFEKDQISWTPSPMTDFYKKLVALKSENPALWNGSSGGNFKLLSSSKDTVLAYSRTLGKNKVVVVINLAKKAVTTKIKLGSATGSYFKYSNGGKAMLVANQSFTVPAGGFEIYSTISTR